MMMTPTTASENWWVLAISGVVAILFGLVALLWPGITLALLVIFFGLFAIIFGIVELFGMFRAMRAKTTWWTYLLIGLLSLGAGIATFVWPGITTFVLLYIIAFWAITVGITEVAVGIYASRWLVVLAGVVTLILGFILLANPFAGALGLVMAIGIVAMIRGIILLIEAFRIPRVAGTPS